MGNTYSGAYAVSSPSVHPHARGEYCFTRALTAPTAGPPPRTWGIQDVFENNPAAGRSTPTHVGNTIAVSYADTHRPVHPHARGEYSLIPARGNKGGGPPPRTWGILERAYMVCLEKRSTPTHVGNTRSCCLPYSVRTVHPHARGEYSARISASVMGSGPPPRTWGIHHLRGNARGRYRSTPTHVGNTGIGPSFQVAVAVHPHARGEYGCHSSYFTCTSGPPPRTWGIRTRPPPSTGGGRSTPTHVGNTLRLSSGRF